jgi:hypothetical protein
MKKLLTNINLFLKTYPLAKSSVLSQSESKYMGTVRMQICYNLVRKDLLKNGIEEKDITGAIIYLAISIAYLINVKN